MIIPGFAQVMRKSLLRLSSLHSWSVDPYVPHEQMSHDIWFVFWASVLGKIAYVADPLVRYRQHEANTSEWPNGIIEYILTNISKAESFASANATAAQDRLALLHRSLAVLEQNDRPAIEAAIAFYSPLSRSLSQRLGVYRGKTLISRARELLSLLRQGAYTKMASDSFGLDSLLLDAVIGVAVRRVGRSNSIQHQASPNSPLPGTGLAGTSPRYD
jgi:hypothetical protein